ncbi:MAG: preprotein translocase subunit SecA [Candidatus Colwellbacteria bacterium]|nr:preprotein translocase subunit SecA [Candidatus Colwellbacteria bacterium]
MILKSIFGNPQEKKSKAILERINALESSLIDLKDDELKKKSSDIKDRVSSGESLDDVLPESFALVREAAKRTLGQRHFDTQLMGAINLHNGSIVEMMTGEGKTLAVTPAVYLNALSGKGVHIITVNDYLASRDAVWMGQIYWFLGLKVSCLVHNGAYIYDPDFSVSDEEEKEADKRRDETGSFLVQHKFLRPVSRKEAYLADVVHGTNHEFGFDYLRDNLSRSKSEQAQREHNFAVIDEVDSILIDEARTPLIISAPDRESSEQYKIMTRAVSRLVRDEDYTLDEKMRSVEITQAGIDKVEKATGVSELYSPENLQLVHYLDECLKAKALFERDRDYVVKDGEVIIVDQFTGRMMYGRRYSGGLHQAIEAKEGVAVQEESKTYAQITIQNYFRLYSKLSGMTGTAQTSAEEFHKVYNLETVTIPTNKPIARKDMPDLVYKTTDAKYKAVVEEIREKFDKGQPVLIGTVSIEKNETLAGYLNKAGLPYEVLNAKNHEREGSIIAQAGRKGAITVATNMAGRGVDIILGGSPYEKENADEVRSLGGLHVIGTERHEARRIDNQLRGRSGRQGDPGSSRFFLSLEDDLMRIFGGERLKSLMQSLNIPDNMPIESRLVSRSIIEAQRKIEGFHFDSRKHLLEYDDVLNKQRLAIYKKRQEILEADKEDFLGIIGESIDARAEKLSEEELAKNNPGDIKKKISDLEGIEWMKGPVLGTLDMLWMNHLEDLEALNESVRIRAYGQHDPLVEYRRESHTLYNDLLDNFNALIFDNMSKIQSIEVKKGEAPTSQQRSDLPPLDMSPEKLAKIGRNDPCPCGAKKPDGTPIKFKHCHGR